MKYLLFILSMSIQAKSYELNEVYEHAVTNHPQGKILASKVREVEIGIARLKGQYLPEVSAIVGAERRQGHSEDSINTDRFVAELRLKYNLFRFNRTGNEVDALKKVLEKNRSEFEWWKRSLLRNLKYQSFMAQALQEKIEYYESELSQNKDLKKKATKRRKSGLIGKSDLLDIQLRKDSLLNQINDLKEELDHSFDKLRGLAYLNHDDDILLKNKIPHVHVDLNLESLIKLAKTNNQSVKMSSLLQESKEMELKGVDKNWLPEVNLMGRYGRMRIDEQYGTKTPEGLVGLYVEIPLFDGGGRKNTREIYKEKYKQKVLETKLLKANSAIEITHKYELLQNTHRKLDLLEESYKRGEVYFRNVLSEYDRGIKNSLDLVSARDRLMQLGIELIEAKEKYMLSKLSIEEIIGQTI